MNNKRVFLFAILAMSALVVLAAHAQESTDAACDIDLSDTISRLEAAQASAKSGDVQRAVRLMADARQQLAAFEAECGGADLSATYTISVSGQGTLTFNFPVGWVTNEEGEESLTIATSQSVLDDKSLFGPDAPTFALGEALGNVALADLGFYGGTEDLGDDARVEDIVTILQATIQEEVNQKGEVTTLSIGDRRAAQLVASTQQFGLIFILVDLGRGGEGRQFAHVVLLTAPDELAPLEKVALRIAESFEFRAVND